MNFFQKTINHKTKPADMNIQEELKENKLSMIAMHLIIRDNAAQTDLSLEGTVTEICREACVNRTQVYEQKVQINKALEQITLPGPGRPLPQEVPASERVIAEWDLQVALLNYRLDNPGALVQHESGRTVYSSGYIRTVLNHLDQWAGSLERFCTLSEVPYPTLEGWKRKDVIQPYIPTPKRPIPLLDPNFSDIVRMIVEDYARWQGSLGDFLTQEPQRVNVPPNQIRNVLEITGMISKRKNKSPRYRGSTTKLQPGTMLVTDGKEIKVHLTSSQEACGYNWQGIVDQATACHTAVVVTETETAEGVRRACEESARFMGRKPEALLHDNKPIHKDQKLRKAIEPETTMIPATPGRPENKAVIEGEFGKFEQAVGSINLDDSTPENLVKSAVEEVVRAYTAGINHAGRVELDGISRMQALKSACTDPEQDRAFLENLKARQDLIRKPDCLPTMNVARLILDQGFTDFQLDHLDPKGALRTWLSSRYTPEAIRQALAIFATERAKGRLKSETSHRYLVKVIQNCQYECDLRVQEIQLRKYAETERRGFLEELEREHDLLVNQCKADGDLALQLSENAVFGGLVLQRAFWEEKLKALLTKLKGCTDAVIKHIRRLFEADWNDRFQLISRLIAWENAVTV